MCAHSRARCVNDAPRTSRDIHVRVPHVNGAPPAGGGSVEPGAPGGLSKHEARGCDCEVHISLKDMLERLAIKVGAGLH